MDYLKLVFIIQIIVLNYFRNQFLKKVSNKTDTALKITSL